MIPFLFRRLAILGGLSLLSGFTFAAVLDPVQEPLLPVAATSLHAIRRGFVPNPDPRRDAAVRFVLQEAGVTAYFTPSGFVMWNGRTTRGLRDGRVTDVPVAPRWELVGAKPVEPVGGDTLPHTISCFRGSDPRNWRSGVPGYREICYPGIRPGVDMRLATRAQGIEYSFNVQPLARPDLRFRYDGIVGLEKKSDGGLVVRTADGHFTESAPIAFQWVGEERREVPAWFEVVSATEYRLVVGEYDERHELIIDPVLDWSSFLGGTYLERLRSIQVDPDGNILVAGDASSIDLTDSAGFTTGPGVNIHPSTGAWVDDVILAKISPDGTRLLWAGYLGGSGPTVDLLGWKGLGVDAAGDVYLTGTTSSPDFPVTVGDPPSGSAEAFVTKIKADGSAILWSRVLGGANEEYGFALALDPAGDLALTGTTRSANFPVTAGAFDATLGGSQDAFVARLSGLSGVLQWSTLLGGSSEEHVVGLAAADNGDFVILGDTASADFPTANALDATLGGVNDAFVTRLAGDGTGLVWSTFLGGSAKEHDQLVGGGSWPFSWAKGDIALDGSGNVVVVGQTFSADFPTTAGAYQTARRGQDDAFVTKISADGSQYLFSTYLGGTGPSDPDGREEIAWGVAVNPWNEIFVGGWSQSTNFPTTAGAFKTAQPNLVRYDGFLSKLDAAGTQLLYSSYLGGSENNDVVLDLDYHSGSVFLAGWSAAATFPTTAGAFQPGCVSCGIPNNWASDGFAVKFLDALVAHDGFESGGFAGGLGGWTGGWTASGDISVLTTSSPHSGTRHVRLRNSTGYLQRTVQVPPAAVSLKLGFWAKVESFESPDQAQVLAKSTGASFTPVASFTPAHSDSRYHYYEIDLTSFLPATQIQIAFDAGMNASSDSWYLDDIRLTGTSGIVPPIADAGADRTVTDSDNSGAEAVALNGAASSDPDGGGIVAYEWREGSTLLGTTVGISPVLPVGTHTLTLTVTDDEGATASDTVQVTVNPFVAPVEVFADGFEVGEWNGLWTEDTQNRWTRTSARKSVGSWAAEVVGSATDAALTSPAINLAGRTSATITFDWRIESTLDTGEYLQFKVSTNGGSTWTQQAILRGDVDPENIWRSVTVELTGISQLKLQFLGKMNRTDERAEVDNVKVIAH